MMFPFTIHKTPECAATGFFFLWMLPFLFFGVRNRKPSKNRFRDFRIQGSVNLKEFGRSSNYVANYVLSVKFSMCVILNFTANDVLSTSSERPTIFFVVKPSNFTKLRKLSYWEIDTSSKVCIKFWSSMSMLTLGRYSWVPNKRVGWKNWRVGWRVNTFFCLCVCFFLYVTLLALFPPYLFIWHLIVH